MNLTVCVAPEIESQNLAVILKVDGSFTCTFTTFDNDHFPACDNNPPVEVKVANATSIAFETAGLLSVGGKDDQADSVSYNNLEV